MNLQSIVITNGIGIAMIIILLMCSSLSRRRKSLSDRLFTVMLMIVASCCIAEPLTFLIDGMPGQEIHIILEIANTWCYVFNVSFSLLWCLYVDYHLYHNRRRLMVMFGPMLVLTAILILVILGNLYGHYLFVIDAGNVYSRKSAAYLFFVIPVGYVLLSSIDVFKYKRTGNNVQFFPIWAFLTPFFFGCILQALIYGVSLAWCSTAIGLTALYMCLQNEQVFKDPLTHLLNRHYLNTVLKTSSWNRGKAFSGIMIDVDYFKSINDNYGHSKGDEALCDAANILTDNVPSTAAVIRFAGDEFIILLRTTQIEEIENVSKKIRSAMQSFNQEGLREYVLSVSMGYGLYYPGKSTQDGFLEDINQNMYENKRERHESGDLAERRHD